MHMKRQFKSKLQSHRSRTTLYMDRAKVRKLRQAFGTKTDTETVDQALSLALANIEIDLAIDQIFGRIPDIQST